MCSVMFAPFVLIATVCLQVDPGPPEEDNDPAALQRRAIQRIDDYTDTFRKTGDLAAKLPELQLALDELEASDDAFIRRGDLAAAALGSIKKGDILRMVSDLRRDQGGRGQALELYRRGEELARRAKHPAYQAKALIGQVRVESTRLGIPNWGAAANHIEQAIRLCEPLKDKTLLFEALDYAAKVQIGRGNLRGAAATLERALTLAPKIGDPFLLYFLYLDRADVYEMRVKLAGFERDFDACFKVVGFARADYERARALAQANGFQHLAGETDKFLKRLEITQVSLKNELNSINSTLKMVFDDPARNGGLVVSDEFLPQPGAPAVLLALVQSVLKENFTGDAQSYWLLGLASEMGGANDAALRAYLRGVQLLETDRRHVDDEQGRLTFLEDKVGCYHAAIRHYLQRKQFAEAFDLMERSRARVLADLLASRNLGFSTQKERDLDAQYRKLEAKIGELQEKLFTYTSDGERERNAKMIAQLDGHIRDLEAERQHILDLMAREAPRLRDLYVSSPTTLRELPRKTQSSVRECEPMSYLTTKLGVRLILRQWGSDQTKLSKLSPEGRYQLQERLVLSELRGSERGTKVSRCDIAEMTLICLNFDNDRFTNVGLAASRVFRC